MSDSLTLLKYTVGNACLCAICAAKATSGKYSMSHFEQTAHRVIFILDCYYDFL